MMAGPSRIPEGEARRPMARWDPAEYHRHSTPQREWARGLLAKLDLAGKERVLDIGCGDGKITAEIAAGLPRGSVLGIDSSEEMIRFARSTFPPERLPGLRFEAIDARELPFVEAFEVVFSNATLHWVIDHRPVLAGIARGLVPGGCALLQMGGRGNAAAVVAVMDELTAQPEWREHFDGFAFPYGFHEPVAYRAWLEEAGLDPRRVELLPKDMVQEGAEGLAGWIRTTWLPYLERVPLHRREALIAAAASRYAEAHPPDAAGRLHVAMVRLEVEAVRPR
jgi:trans-aconitate 2-methyltransferase